MRALLAVTLLMVSCHRPSLIGASGVLRVTQTRVDFGERWLQSSAAKRLELTNTGRASLTVSFTAHAPFETIHTLRLGGGESTELEVHFKPTVLGPVESELVLEVEGSQHRVTLEGEGVEPPPCDSTVCRTAVLDELTTRCVLSPVADGDACADACLEGARCEGGGCVGQPRRCDDGDPCTLDACDSFSGCTHATKVCQPLTPCMTGRCDPVLGCVEVPSVDGAACGAADCVTAQVCIQGQCVARVVPDGAPCGRGTLCQAEGRCAAQVCVQPAATPLVKQWSYEVTRAHRLHGLVADSTGALFTVECVNAGTFRAQCSLLGLEPTGAFRFRTPFPHLTDTGSGGLWATLLVAGDLVISAVEQSRLVAVDRTTGVLAWVVDTRTFGLFTPSTTTVRPVAVGFDGQRTVIAVLEARSFGSITGNAIIGLDFETGALTRSVALPAQGASLAIDRSSNFYLGHSVGGGAWTDSITSFDPVWSVRWQRIASLVGPYIRTVEAVHGNTLLWAHRSAGELTSLGNGATTAGPAPQGLTRGVVWSDHALFVLHQFCPTATCTGFSDYRLELLTFPADGSAAKHGPLPELRWFSSLWLTTGGTALLSLGERTGTATLVELDASGSTLMRCPLGLEPGRKPRTTPILSAGRYVMISGEQSEGQNPRIDAWGLPGYAPATRGWVSEKGGPEQDLRAR